MYLVMLLYLLFASTFTLAKAAVSYMPPILFVGIRMLIAGSLLLAFVWLWRRKSWRFEKRDALLFAGIIFFHIYAAYVFEFISLPCLSSFKASLLYSISPFLTALIAYLFLQEKMSWQKWLGLIIGFLSLVPIMYEQSGCTGEPLKLIAGIRPEFLLFIAILSSVIGWLCMKKLVGFGYSPLMVNGVGMGAGGILALFTSFALEGMPRLYEHAAHGMSNLSMVVIIMGLLIIIANFISYNFYGYLLGRYSATFLSFAGFLCPIFTAVLGWLFLHETISLHFLISAFGIFCGLYIFYRQELAQS